MLNFLIRLIYLKPVALHKTDWLYSLCKKGLIRVLYIHMQITNANLLLVHDYYMLNFRSVESKKQFTYSKKPMTNFKRPFSDANI